MIEYAINKRSDGRDFRFWTWSGAFGFAFALLLGCNSFYETNFGGSGLQLPWNVSAVVALLPLFIISSFRILWLRTVLVSRITVVYGMAITALLLLSFLADTTFWRTKWLRFAFLYFGLFVLIVFDQFPEIRRGRLVHAFLFFQALFQWCFGFFQYFFVYETTRWNVLASEGRPTGIFQQVNDYLSFLTIGALILVFWSVNEPQKKLFRFVTPVYIAGAAILGVWGAANSGKAVLLSSVCIFLFMQRNFLSKPVIWSCLIAGLFVLIPREWIDIRAMTSQVSELSRSPSLNNSDPSQGAQAQAPDAGSQQNRQLEIKSKEPAILIADQENSNPSRIPSWLGERGTMYAVQIRMLADLPFFGSGLGSFPRQYIVKQAEYASIYKPSLVPNNSRHPHNELVLWAVELGWLAPFIILISLAIPWFFSVAMKCHKPALLLLLPLLIHSLLELPLYHSFPHALAALCLLWVSQSGSSSFSWRLMLVPAGFCSVILSGLGIVVVIFSLATMHTMLQLRSFYAQGKVKTEPLEAVVAPAAWKIRYEFEYLFARIRQGERDGEIPVRDLQAFLYWGYSVLQYFPDPGIRWSMVQALELGGLPEQALKYAEEGRYLYPLDSRFNRQIKRLEQFLDD